MAKRYLIWIDDERPIPHHFYDTYNEENNFYILRASNYKAATGWLENIHTFTPDAEVIVCFDHDLGEEKTGYDIAKFIVENKIKISAYDIQSMNPIGRLNISELLNHYGYKRIYIV